MRKTIFEQIKDKVSYASEISRMDTLIKDPLGIQIKLPREVFDVFDKPIYKYYSLENFFDKFKFKTWKARGTCIDCDDMRETLNLDEIVSSDNPTLDETLTYCEYVANLIKLYNRAELDEDTELYDTEIISAISDNLKSLLDWLNQEAVFFENEEMVLITEKNATVSAVAECVDENLAYQIVKYNHYTLKGNIAKKKEILLNLGNVVEPKRADISSANKKLSDNIFFMLNNLNIRHNNVSKKDDNYKEYTADMSDEELEKWYDELYQMILLAILELEQIDRNRLVDELKSHY